MDRFRDIKRYSKRVLNLAKPKIKEEAAKADFSFKSDIIQEDFSISWCIENIYRCPWKPGEYLESPSFSIGFSNQIKCSLVVCQTDATSEIHLGLAIPNLPEDPVSTIKYRFSIQVKPLAAEGVHKVKSAFYYPSDNSFADAKGTKLQENTQNVFFSKCFYDPQKKVTFPIRSDDLKKLKSLHIVCLLSATLVEDEVIHSFKAGK